MAQATSDVVALQLEKVRRKLPELFEYEDTLFSTIQNRTDVEKVSSRVTRVPLQIRPGSRFRIANLGGGALGRGTATNYQFASLAPLASTINIEINEDVLAQTDGEPKAIRKILAQEIKNAMREFRRQLNAQLQTAGDCIQATVSASTGTTITVLNAPFYAQLLRAGQTIQIYDSTVTTNRGSATISYIDYVNSVLTVDATPAGTISGDVVLLDGVSGANPVGYFGIPYQVSSSAVGTWLNLSRVTVPEIRASNYDVAGNALTTFPIRLLLTKIRQRIAGSASAGALKSLRAHLHDTQAAAYEELAILVTKIEKGSGNEAIDMLFGDQRMAGVPQMRDIHASRNRIDFMNLDSWGRVESLPVDFLKLPDGTYITRPVDSSTGSPVAAILFYICWFGQFFLDNPATNGYISSLAIPSGYDAL